MPKFTVEMDTEGYRLACEDEAGAIVPYGEIAALGIGDAVYYTCIDEPDDDAEIAALQVFRVDSITPFQCEVEETEFEEEEEGEEDEGDEEPVEVETPDEEGEEVPE